MRKRKISKVTISSLLSVVVWLLVLSVSSGSEKGEGEKKPSFRRAVLIRFEGPITPSLQGYFNRKLAAAEKEGADLLIVEIDSGGGMVVPSFEIAETLAAVTWAKTVAYVPRQAYSGAAVVAFGCDEIVMAPRASLGDIGMIFLDGDQMAFRYVEAKQVSPWIVKLRDLAKEKGRSPALLEAMMRLKTVVHQYKNEKTGDVRYMTAADARDAEADEPGDWKKGKLLTDVDPDRKQFLTVSGIRGEELGLADGAASSRKEAAKRYGIIADEMLVMEYTNVDLAVDILNHPLVTGLLFVIGLVCLYIEFSAPGIGIGGLTAVLCFTLFFWSRFLGGTAEWLEVLLFLAGVGFLLVEMFIFPGFGVAGLTGVLLMLAGVILASQQFIIPRDEAEISTLTTSLGVIVGAAIVFVATAVWLTRYLPSLPMLRRLTLAPPTSDDVAMSGGSLQETTVQTIEIGARGIAHSNLRPAGTAVLGERKVDVVADATVISRGTAIEVVEINGKRILVKPVDSGDSSKTRSVSEGTQ